MKNINFSPNTKIFMMKMVNRGIVYSIFLCFLGMVSVKAQNCEYTLEMIDFGGDGWNNGAALLVIINGDTSLYRLDDLMDNGGYSRVGISVKEGDQITLSYQSGGIQDIENAYTLFDSEGFELISQGVFPMAGTAYDDIVHCPSCKVSATEGVIVGKVKATSAEISLAHTNENGTVQVLVKEAESISPDIMVYKSIGEKVNLTGLQENTKYEIEVMVVCSVGDTSRVMGPEYFTTRRAIDVGISDISMPVSACDLEQNEEIWVTMTNYGSDPQALFEFKFSVDGEEANINIPLDGYYTGVLGMDSSYTIPFDQKFDFSEKKTYEIKAWTDVPNDSNMKNDTFTLLVTSVPVIEEYPYLAELEDSQEGWTTEPIKSSIWEYGLPQGALLNAAGSGSKCWVTNLDGYYKDDEISFLYSPCLDFSNLVRDPYFSFNMWLGLEANYDFLWLEYSIDEGANWIKLDTRASDINGYNNLTKKAWTGTGRRSYSVWQYTSIRLIGLAGEPAVRLRFVLETDDAVTGEGVGLDQFSISEPNSRDVVALTAVNVQNLNCGSVSDQVSIEFANRGIYNITNLRLGYQINSEVPVIETLSGVSIQPGATSSYLFKTPFNSTVDDDLQIKAWVVLNNDENIQNDTVYYSYQRARKLPFLEDFEETSWLPDWFISANSVYSSGHGNTSQVLSFNLYESGSVAEVILPNVGLVKEGDSITFDYRLTAFETDGSVPHVMGSGDFIVVEVSSDCGNQFENIYTINSDNQNISSEMQTISLSLDPFVGEYVKIAIRAVYGTGDYWLDIDNIGVFGCGTPPALEITTIPESSVGEKDGEIIVSSPREYQDYLEYFWNDGQEGRTLNNVGTGTYILTTRDIFGCSFETSVNVGLLSNRLDILTPDYFSVYPNPTNGVMRIEVNLDQSEDVQFNLFNLNGQLIKTKDVGVTNQYSEELNLSGFQPGVYILQIRTPYAIGAKRIILNP